MKAETAKALVDLLVRHAAEQDALLGSVRHAEPPAEFDRIRAMIGQTMGAIYLEALKPIFDEHADLKPAHLGS